MRKAHRIFAWICRPQALVGFAAVCLCVGALGGIIRTTSNVPLPPRPSQYASTLPVRPHLDCSIKPCLALTFDDGPNPQTTPQVLDILARQQVKATFFVLGMRVSGHEALLRREYREGHEIGNHSWSHPDLSKLSPEDAQKQIESTQNVIAAAGVPAPKILRPPYGAINEMVDAHSNLTVVRWNIDPEDWRLKDPAKINGQLLAHVRPGSIVLMHDIYPSTVATLEPLIQALKQQYQLVTASQLLNLSPGDQGQFFARYK
jgi:peptidoglycan/xylan/chitin deacetylase (PgdA/CDA1 family)